MKAKNIHNVVKNNKIQSLNLVKFFKNGNSIYLLKRLKMLQLLLERRIVNQFLA